MSSVIYIASNHPLEERPNPHERMISVNEAIALGVENIPEHLLSDDFDKDKPDVIMYADREIKLNVFTKEISDGNFDDDFCIFSAEGAEGLKTDKKYKMFLEWYRYTDGRASEVIKYLKNNLENTDDIELWHIWLGNDIIPNTKIIEKKINELSAEDIHFLDGWEPWNENDTDLCIRITH